MKRRFAHTSIAVTAILTLALTMQLPAAGAPSEEVPELVQLGASPLEAQLEAVDADGSLRLRDAEGVLIEMPVDGLVRWSSPAPLRASDALLLSDGSLLALAPAWSSRPSFSFDGEHGAARTRRVGRISVERCNLAAVMLKLPADGLQVAAMIDKVCEMQRSSDADQLLLDNGDVVIGKVLHIGSKEKEGGEGIAFQADFGPIELPLERIRAIIFDDDGDAQPQASRPNQASLMVGLDDGSRIAADRLGVDEDHLLIHSATLGPLETGGIDEVVFLQALAGRLAYLSDLEPAFYNHEPYLDLPWQYHGDRNALGQPLRASDRVYLKGLGMHSTSRLTYDLPGGYDAFAAAVAVDDAAEAGGSVVFRVRLAKKGQWREAWSSDVVRGGEAPLPVMVKLDGADQLELVVDRADRGDERDYANWLDARLERPQ